MIGFIPDDEAALRRPIGIILFEQGEALIARQGRIFIGKFFNRMSIKEKPNDIDIIGIKHNRGLRGNNLLTGNGDTTRAKVRRVGNVVIAGFTERPRIPQIALHTIDRVNEEEQG